eukprot:comp21879_c0_seq1/m.31315 comp21879_c0_seq1/g.31315  ORF comp21879_c0_seq1/g.31315 comp21879_c0_seq1/m.31315 type:complete len:362 (-) comp21879_c0_seq1:96-1181(-)
MSHQSGIGVTEELAGQFATLRLTEAEGMNVRAVKICIENEQLVEKARIEAKGTWEEDYDTVVVPLLEAKQPCYIFYRTDTAAATGQYYWIYIVYVPDFAQVREKMLYASTRATLKREFGDGQVNDELFGTEKKDVNLEGYRKHVASAKAPAPLTFQEKEMAAIKKQEVTAHILAAGKQEIAGGMAFPLDEEATAALEGLKDGKYEYVQLQIDIPAEHIRLSVADSTTTEGVAEKMPEDSPRYHFVAYAHSHEGEQQRPILFIYSCPGYSCPVKERMLYSSCKNNVVSAAEALGLVLARKMEVSEAADLTHECLHNEIHPPPKEEKKVYLKPKPAGRGGRRMHRDVSSDSVNAPSDSDRPAE